MKRVHAGDELGGPLLSGEGDEEHRTQKQWRCRRSLQSYSAVLTGSVRDLLTHMQEPGGVHVIVSASKELTRNREPQKRQGDRARAQGPAGATKRILR